MFAAGSVVRIGAAPGEPAAYLDPQGRVAGFYVDVLDEAARREGLTVEWVLYPRRSDEALLTTAVDVWAAANPSPERRDRFYLSRPWWVADYILLVRADSPIYKPPDTAARTVLFSEFPPSGKLAYTTLPQAKLLPRPSAQERLVAVCAGQADAALLDSNDLQRMLHIRPPGCESTPLRQVPHRDMKMELSMMSLPAKKALVERLRARIDSMIRDGTLPVLASAYPVLSSYSSDVMMSAERASYERRYYLVGFLGSLLAVATMLVLLLLLRQAHSRTRRALSKAREFSRAKSEFMAVMSHEIRTPMHAALGFTELLMRTPLREDQREYAASVRNSVQCLLSIINDVLDLARLRMGPLPVAAESFSPGQLGVEIASMMEVIAEAAGLRFVLRLDPALPARVTADAGRLRQIATNLCGNAVKFTETGQIELAVKASPAEPDAGWLELEVHDTGPGISGEQQQLIFRPFVQLDSSTTRRRGGSGLGLAIVARLCEAMGGSVSVESKVGEGSLFRVKIPVSGISSQSWIEELSLPREAVTLIGANDPRVETLHAFLQSAGVSVERLLPGGKPPSHSLAIVCGSATLLRMEPCRGRLILAASSVEIADLPDWARQRVTAFLPWPAVGVMLRDALTGPALPQVVEPPPESSAEPNGGLLVVEDNEVNRRVMKGMLTHLGWQVELAGNGLEALQRFDHGHYAAILMDCQMPVMDGLQATTEIRKRQNGARIPIIGVTAAAFQEDRDRCFAAGMDDFLPKPVTLDQLSQVLDKWVKRAPTPGLVGD
ncbi:MAG: response regulator [Bryobacterales bacterium]|nr:response regulator [Bryobacterales bacterium]